MKLAKSVPYSSTTAKWYTHTHTYTQSVHRIARANAETKSLDFCLKQQTRPKFKNVSQYRLDIREAQETFSTLAFSEQFNNSHSRITE